MSQFRLFNILFVNGDYNDAFSRLNNGQFMVVPSGPGLSIIDKDLEYWNALKCADFAIPDSGFMIILARLFFGIKTKKLSGPKFLRIFLKEDILQKEGVIFSVDPSLYESKINNQFLNELGVLISKDYHYVAPFYKKNSIVDKNLLAILESLEIKPKFILLNLGGGIQERLGLYIKNNISYKIGIICTGAAIAFETGCQAKIPKFIDNIYLGWFARIIQAPTKFTMRFLKAFRLLYIFYLCKINKLK